tara:strand:- start:709 stop:900 length:192 start_codon:yes stop_codon:yes gene_type:complete
MELGLRLAEIHTSLDQDYSQNHHPSYHHLGLQEESLEAALEAALAAPLEALKEAVKEAVKEAW